MAITLKKEHFIQTTVKSFSIGDLNLALNFFFILLDNFFVMFYLFFIILNSGTKDVFFSRLKYLNKTRKFWVFL